VHNIAYEKQVAAPLGDDIGTLQAFDVSRKLDMLIIMGTSLKVHGLRKLVKDFAPYT